MTLIKFQDVLSLHAFVAAGLSMMSLIFMWLLSHGSPFRKSSFNSSANSGVNVASFCARLGAFLTLSCFRPDISNSEGKEGGPGMAEGSL